LTKTVYRQHIRYPFLGLLILETCTLFGTVYSASYLRFHSNLDVFFTDVESLWISAAIIASVTPIAMLATGLYQSKTREGLAGVLIRIVVSFLGSGLFITGLYYAFPDIIAGRGIIVLAYLQSFFIIGTLRAIFFELIDSEKFKKRVLVFGAGKTASYIDSKLRRKSDRRGFEIVGYVAVEHQNQLVDESKLVNINTSLLEYSRQYGVDEIVIAISDTSQNIPVNELVNCKLNGIETIDILSFFEREAGQIRVDIIDPAWLVTSEGFHQSEFQDTLKRCFDILSSFVILLVASPFLILTVIAIWLEDGITAPIFYSQIRVGKRGALFKVYKFRSMRIDAEKAGAVWASKTDNRITGVGSFIRKTRLDEFPQILNVLNGSMSFVGPRPERPEFINDLAEEIPYYHERHIVKPGVTGWAQLLYPYGASINDSYQKQLFDMYYVKNHNLFLDVLILLQTVEVVLFGKGAR
jgi:sugar transferase (PEP-CTERM system associated)